MLGHSEEYFTKDRDEWWNDDYIELISKRLGINKFFSMLDVGCGKCHWTKVIGGYLNRPAFITAIDTDAKWAIGDEKTVGYFKSIGVDIQFAKMNAYDIRYPDNYFDFVTCQTLLLHLDNPEKAIKEMYRVLQPDGLLLCVEPDNIVNCISIDTVNTKYIIEELKCFYEFNLLYDKGKQSLGLGGCITELMPKYFQTVGLKNIRVYNNDKADISIPPYPDDEMIVNKETHEKDKSKFIFTSLGIDDSFFNKYWNLHDRYQNEIVEQKKLNTYYQTKGYFMYLFSGVK